MSSRRLILQNSLLNFVASVSQRIGQTLIFILVARLLTADNTGAFKLSTTYSSILLTFSLWGLDQLFIREIARHTTKAGHYLSGFLILRLVLAVLFWGALGLLMPLLPYASETKRLILIMTLAIIPGSVSNLYHSVWVAFEDMKVISAILLFFSLVRIAGGVLILWQAETLIAIAWLFLIISLVEMLTNIWFTHRRHDLTGFRWRLDLGFWRDNLRIATPLIIVSFVLVVEYQFDDVILSLFRPEAEVGIYGTAAAILALLLFVTRSYQLAIFPVISRAYHHSPEQLRAVYSSSMKFILLGTFPIAVFVSLFSGQIIGLIYGPGYAGAAPILSILVWAFFISALNVSNSRLMIAADRQQVMAKYALLSTTGNVILSLLLVPRLGGIGTAWARVLAMPLYSIPALLYVQRHICSVEWREWWQLDFFKRTP